MSYTHCGRKQLAHMEGMGRVIRLVKNAYEPDPIGPLSISSWHPPPVKRLIAIYIVLLYISHILVVLILVVRFCRP